MPRYAIWQSIAAYLFLIFTTAISPLSGIASEPLNIVLLYADDWRHDTLGIAGNPVVKTPHLDELAKQGVRFSRHCVTTSICGVSRATLLTGQWMSRHGNRGFTAFKTPWEQTYPELLRANGYYVGHVGKWYTGPVRPETFDFFRLTGGGHWLTESDGSKIHATKKNEKDALEFFESRPKDKPFCLTVAFNAVHAIDNDPEQYFPQPESMALYQDVTVPTPRTGSDEHFKRLPPFIANEKNEGRNRWGWRFDTPERFQKYIKNYYRMVTEVDAACGRVLATLKEKDLLDNTLVIFSTDNGYFLGEHGLADKWYPYEESLRVPLIVRDPRLPSDSIGQTREELTLNVDLAPTILAAANVAPPATMQGTSVTSLYLDPNATKAWRKDFYYEHGTIHSKEFIPSSEALVNHDWKYIYWPEFEHEELYHLAEDPFEEENIVQNPEVTEKLDELRARFKVLKENAK